MDENKVVLCGANAYEKKYYFNEEQFKMIPDSIKQELHVICVLFTAEVGGVFTIAFEEDGNVMQIIEFQHVKPGKGAAFVRTKIRNVITGSVVEKSYNPTAKFPTAYVERKDMEYTYNDGDLYHFMDSETYEDVPINKAELSDNFKFVKENMVCKVLSYKGKVFGVEPPNFVELEITDTDPGFRGDTATNVTKPATLETGAEIRVPLFVEIGDIIRIDTRTGEYMERVTNK